MKSSKNKLKFSSVLLTVLIGLFFLSCEQVINPTLQSASPILVVDAWVNNKPEKQLIILTQTQPYFDDAQPTGVSGAVVTVADLNDGTVYAFTENPTKKGYYEWTPTTSGTFGAVGHDYTLTIALNEEVFGASSHMGRVPQIDSITFEKDVRARSKDTRYQGEFWAKDPAGIGDTYWIRAIKNDTLLNKPSEINIAYDQAFSAGGEAKTSDKDTLEFIPPIRRGITPNNSDVEGNPSPFWPGDSIYVEIHSITLAAFNYLNEVKVQTDRPGGFSELFARPIANVSTNVSNTNPKGSAVMGFFNVGAVSGRGQKFVKTN